MVTVTTGNNNDMGLFDKKTCRTHEAFSRYIGEEVVIFYSDVNGDRRKVYGRIVAIDHDVIHMEREQTGWKGCIDSSVCKVGQVSTLKGWGAAEDENNE